MDELRVKELESRIMWIEKRFKHMERSHKNYLQRVTVIQDRIEEVTSKKPLGSLLDMRKDVDVLKDDSNHLKTAVNVVLKELKRLRPRKKTNTKEESRRKSARTKKRHYKRSREKLEPKEMLPGVCFVCEELSTHCYINLQIPTRKYHYCDQHGWQPRMFNEVAWRHVGLQYEKNQ